MSDPDSPTHPTLMDNDFPRDPPPYPDSPYPYDLPRLNLIGNSYRCADLTKWNRRTDDLLLDFLLMSKDQGKLDPTKGPYTTTAVEAQLGLQNVFGVTFTVDEVEKRIYELKERYDYFFELIHSKCTFWQHNLRLVSVDHNVYKKMQGTNKVSYCNAWEEEPLYTKMQAVFEEKCPTSSACGGSMRKGKNKA